MSDSIYDTGEQVEKIISDLDSELGDLSDAMALWEMTYSRERFRYENEDNIFERTSANTSLIFIILNITTTLCINKELSDEEKAYLQQINDEANLVSGICYATGIFSSDNPIEDTEKNIGQIDYENMDFESLFVYIAYAYFQIGNDTAEFKATQMWVENGYDYPYALFHLGYLYKKGIGTAASESDAQECFRKVIEYIDSGDIDDPREYVLKGELLYSGWGCDTDYQQAKMLYRQAIDNGCNEIRSEYIKLFGDDLDENEKPTDEERSIAENINESCATVIDEIANKYIDVCEETERDLTNMWYFLIAFMIDSYNILMTISDYMSKMLYNKCDIDISKSDFYQKYLMVPGTIKLLSYVFEGMAGEQIVELSTEISQDLVQGINSDLSDAVTSLDENLFADEDNIISMFARMVNDETLSRISAFLDEASEKVNEKLREGVNPYKIFAKGIINLTGDVEYALETEMLNAGIISDRYYLP